MRFCRSPMHLLAFLCTVVARHGAAASRVARETAAKFQFKGDTEGHVVWGRVADAVERRSLTSIVGESVTPLS